MPSDRGEPARDRIPDPAALAQGHRLLRAANGLELPAWVCGWLGLLTLCSSMMGSIWEFVLGWALMFSLAWLVWGEIRTPSMRATAARGPRLPGEIHDLLALLEGLIDTLERGQDRSVNRDVMEIGVILDDLGPEACRYLDERGADRARLRHGVSWFDSGISADQRRALHHELLRFGAAARGRACGDPYRARMSDGPTLLAVVRDPALARTRRRCAGLLLSIVVIWGAVSRGLAPMLGGLAPLRIGSWRLCNPWGDNPNCKFMHFEPKAALEHFDPFMTSIYAVALVPMFLLVVAHVAREAAWQSWAAALPSADGLPVAPEGRPFVRARRCQRALPWLRRKLAWLVCSFIAGILVVAHDWWNWPGFTLNKQIVIIELVTLALVVISALVAKFERDCECGRLADRIGRAPSSAALLTELFDLRRELEHTAPVRAELLEQLAETLEQATALGRLSTQDRDRVVARLRAGAAGGPTVSREQRDLLSLDVRSCEALIGKGVR